ncbi:MAG: Asp-tRNA(Asn)/Glu-tRNA(Gln) amidotransferase subunit GatB [Planctomycetota bacterium]|nr:Asp-tRNA(Asn)/Glu-tRNA(Gln) amidotransferase subunit GatB [Planctomycetota bacterium]
MSWQTVVGLEIHAQMSTRSKMFCGCPRETGQDPNQNICPVCTGWPGALPVINEVAVRCAIRAAICLDCSIQNESRFDRKNYFYPDLPKGYQISQFYRPYALGGSITFEREDSSAGNLPLVRIHMEEDAGKSIHSSDGTSRIDLNRCSSPLLEIVTEPLAMSGVEAASCVRSLRHLLRWVGVCDGDMEKGNLRCDVNVSVRPDASADLGTRTELKNLNSFVSIQRSVEVESQRQVEILENGGTIRQETRLWDQDREVTEEMRGKEDSPDYRYFPEPDLPVVIIEQADINQELHSLPELPQQRHQRYVEDLGIAEREATPILARRQNGEFFDALMAAGLSAAQASNWFRGEVLRHLNEREQLIEDYPLSADSIARVVEAVEEDRISVASGRDILQKALDEGRDPTEVLAESAEQIRDESALLGWVSTVMSAHPEAVEKIRSGDSKPMGFLMGQVMKASSGQAHPRMVQELLQRLIQQD